MTGGWRRRVLAGAVAVTVGSGAASLQAAVDLAALWDFSNPALSEQRFAAALASASGDDALVLRTQIARTHGLRRDFERSRSLLSDIEPQLAGAGPETRARHALEWGRSWISATHASALRTPAARDHARAAYARAEAAAREGGLDELAVDALHMMAFVDEAPADQIRWNRQALELALKSARPAARAWEASLRHNLGLALKADGRPYEALDEFTAAARLRDAAGQTERARVAHWMVAWTLRAIGRVDEALAIQHWLESVHAAAGKSDPFVFEELALLYRARGLDAKAAEYEARHKAVKR